MKEIKINKSASKGVSMGRAYIVKKQDMIIDKSLIKPQQIQYHIDKFTKSVADSVAEIEVLAENSDIFSAHLEVINDPTLYDAVIMKIKDELKNAELSLQEATDDICSMFEVLDDEYLKERASDIKDVSKRLMCHIKGIDLDIFSGISEQVIVIAQDLTPSDTANMDFGYVKGFITASGGVTSHVSIIARQLQLPAIVGVKNILSQINDSDYIIIDAVGNRVILNPDEDTKQKYTIKANEYIKRKELFDKENHLPCITKDGRCVKLYANVGNIEDVCKAVEHCSEGVGLFRSEFLYMESKHFPTEQEQFEVYKQATEQNKNPMIVRTLDIGGDKPLPYHIFDKEDNPFLGFRAIRISLELKDMFKTQLRALLRASAFGDIRIMYPMIISVEEFLQANEILKKCKDELKKEGTHFNDNIQTGVMIETPASVFIAEDLAIVSDFLSIGTNDLTQYILAVDRGNEKISHLYDTYHPAVLRAIKSVIDAGHKYGKEVGMCGEFASEENGVEILLGMGLDEFSMSSNCIAQVRYQIRHLNYINARELSRKVFEKKTIKEVMSCL